MNIRHLAAFRRVKAVLQTPSLLACSGGIDSSALLILAAHAYDDGAVAPLVVHVDHQTRSNSSQDSAVVHALADRFGLPFVATATSRSGRRSESAMREDRYASIAEIGRHACISRVMTAHTRTDQVETVLMRLFSGSGALASAGMRAEQRIGTPVGAIDIIRPMLESSRAELESIVTAFGVQPIDDASNEDRSYRRNALRMDVVPLLQKIWPGFEGGLERAVRLSATDSDFLDGLASAYVDKLASLAPGLASIERAELVGLHQAVATRVVRIVVLWMIDGDTRELSEERVRAVVAAAAGRSGSLIQLPHGILVRVRHDTLEFTTNTGGTIGDGCDPSAASGA